MVWFWLTLTIILTVVEISTVQFVSIWFSVGAAVSTVAVAIFPTINIGWQIVIFAVTATVLLIATRPLVKRFLEKRTEEQKTNLDLIIGKDAIVTEKIDNINGMGAVKINGLTWSARSDGADTIDVGELVTIDRIVGNKVIIKRKENSVCGG